MAINLSTIYSTYAEKIKIQLIEKQIWVAICCVALAFFIQLVINKVDIILLVIQFFSTISMYNLAVYNKNLSFDILIFRVLIPLLISVSLGFYYLEWGTLVLFIFLGIISMQYSLPVFGKNLREVQRLKIFIIAITWASSIVLAPILNSGELLGIQGFLIWLSVFLFVLAISIPFDWRDLTSDATELKTLPQELGREGSLKLANIMLVFSVLFFILAQDEIVNYFILSYLGSVIVACYLFKKSSKFSKKYFVSFWVEILSATPLILYLILQFSELEIF